MNFFKLFPTVDYNFQNSNGDYALTMTNLTVHVRLVERLKKSITVLYDYAIQDGERPDTVSMNLYGTPDYTWIILVLNNIFSLFDWPLQPDEFTNFIIERYGSVAAAQTTYLYQTSDGFFVDLATWTALTASQRRNPLSKFDHQLDLNEQKRNIKVVPIEFVSALATELKKILAS